MAPRLVGQVTVTDDGVDAAAVTLEGGATGVLMLIDQHSSVPVSPANESVILSFQVPLAATPDLPLNAESGCSGRKLPTNGADPCVM